MNIVIGFITCWVALASAVFLITLLGFGVHEIERAFWFAGLMYFSGPGIMLLIAAEALRRYIKRGWLF